MNNYDFGGWATRFNIKCADGRTILPEAFADCSGKTVPIVWNHRHNEASNVLGHALLENRDNGVYCYGTFNDNPEGRGAKELVKHGDITSLSIYANELRPRKSPMVQHGVIREVSLVLAGANPGAYIDDVICHSEDGLDDDGAVIYSGMEFEEILEHSNDECDSSENQNGVSDTNSNVIEKETDTMQHDYETTIENEGTEMSDEELMHALDSIDMSQLTNDELNDVIEFLEHSVKEDPNVADSNKKTVKEIFDSLTEEQKNVVYAIVGVAVEDAINENKKGDDGEMTHNVFENDHSGDYIAHAREAATEMFAEALADAKSYGSLKESVLAHGIEDIDILFPDAKTMDNEIDLVTRNMDWVKVVMDGVHKTPFSRVRSIFADLTDDDARALGYIKGNFKKEQVFTLLKRETQPTTIYKKQKIHRDDLVDITDFDIVRLVMKEMRMLLEEEIARAILVGDGRNPSSNDKVNENCIRPIWTDEDFFTIKYTLPDDSGRAFVEGAVRARVNYKGKGNPTLFVTEQKLTELLLMTDAVGRDLYDSVEKLATKLRVAKVITVPVMDGLVRVDAKTGKAYALQGLIVNLTDYNTGTDKGGEVKTFDQFDIDYNAQKYLIETRLSGAMVTPFAAIALETETTAPETDEG